MNKTVSYLAFESAQARSERIIKRLCFLNVALVLLIAGILSRK